MNAIHFLIDVVFDLFLIVVILRLWMQAARVDYYNPMSQFVVKVTNPLVVPLRTILPSKGKWDLACLALAFLVAIAKILLLTKGLLGLIPSVSDLLLMSVALVISQFLSVLFWLVLIMALMSWFTQGYHPIMAMLQQLTQPFLAPIRRIIPPIGGLDLSVLVLVIAIQFVRILLGNLLGIGI